MGNIGALATDEESDRLAQIGSKIIALSTAVALGYLAFLAQPAYSEQKRKLPIKPATYSKQIDDSVRQNLEAIYGPCTSSEYLAEIYALMKNGNQLDSEIELGGALLYIGPELSAINRVTGEEEKYRKIIYVISREDKLFIYHQIGKQPVMSSAMGDIPEDFISSALIRDIAFRGLFEKAYRTAISEGKGRK